MSATHAYPAPSDPVASAIIAVWYALGIAAWVVALWWMLR